MRILKSQKKYYNIDVNTETSQTNTENLSLMSDWQF